MKILVFSDSHNKLDNMFNIIDKIGDKMDAVIHLGDVVSDQRALEFKYPDNKYYFVKGNNDYNSDVQEFLHVSVNNRRLLLSHGHKQKVNWGFMNISCWAMENNVDVVLFGHTHMPVCEYSGSLILFNPGSISLPRNTDNPTFGIINISDNGIINCSIMEYMRENKFKIMLTC